MNLIPVIDLQEGRVVRAHGGQRALYRPIVTPLCPGSDPFDMVRAFLALHKFQALYIADLDALTGARPQTELIAKLTSSFQSTRFWVDGGWPVREGDWTPVIGTESLDFGLWQAVRERKDDWILSLDHFDGHYVGPREFLLEPETWPQKVLAMCLNRVGSNHGPDFERLRQLRELAPNRWLAAAGGVRGPEDLQELAKIGIDGALVASALHDGRLVTFE